MMITKIPTKVITIAMGINTLDKRVWLDVHGGKHNSCKPPHRLLFLRIENMAKLEKNSFRHIPLKVIIRLINILEYLKLVEKSWCTSRKVGCQRDSILLSLSKLPKIEELFP